MSTPVLLTLPHPMSLSLSPPTATLLVLGSFTLYLSYVTGYVLHARDTLLRLAQVVLIQKDWPTLRLPSIISQVSAHAWVAITKNQMLVHACRFVLPFLLKPSEIIVLGPVCLSAPIILTPILIPTCAGVTVQPLQYLAPYSSRINSTGVV